MQKPLYQELQHLGMDDKLAAKISAALEPDNLATRKDLQTIQESLLQHQAKSEKSRYEMASELACGFCKLRTEMTKVQTELKTMRRQYWIIFAGFISTIISIFVVNWYFHSL